MREMSASSLYFKKTVVNNSFESLVAQLKDELMKEGFIWSPETNFQSAFLDQLKVHYKKYSIFHAYIPHLYHQMLAIEPFEGIVLPCSITVAESRPGEILVIPVNPTEIILRSIRNPSLQNLSEEVSRRLSLVIEALAKRPSPAADRVTSWDDY